MAAEPPIRVAELRRRSEKTVVPEARLAGCESARGVTPGTQGRSSDVPDYDYFYENVFIKGKLWTAISVAEEYTFPPECRHHPPSPLARFPEAGDRRFLLYRGLEMNVAPIVVAVEYRIRPNPLKLG